MSSTKTQTNQANNLIMNFFDRHLVHLSPSDSSIARKRSGASWCDNSKDSYFVDRAVSQLTVEDFEFSWNNSDVVIRRLASYGHGSGLKRELLVDLVSLHNELKVCHVDAGDVSNDIYVMF
jgi:hypothetical protein